METSHLRLFSCFNYGKLSHREVKTNYMFSTFLADMKD